MRSGSSLASSSAAGRTLPRTGDAEGFTIVQEEAVGKGIRRITAFTSTAAHGAAAQADKLTHRLAALQNLEGEALATAADALTKQVNEATLPATARARLQQGLHELSGKLRDAKKGRGQGGAAGCGGGGPCTCRVRHRARSSRASSTTRTPPRSARRWTWCGKKHPEAAILLAGISDGKVALIASVPDALIKQGLKAGDWVKAAAQVVGGGGGGRPDMAQAGGKDPAKVDEALAVAQAHAESKL